MRWPLDPTSAAFLIGETRTMPMHVAGLELYEPPPDAGPDYPRVLYRRMVTNHEVAPLFLKRPVRTITTGGQWAWTQDHDFDIEYHVRHSALPAPGRVRELLELTSRLHGTMLSRDRPLWEAHLIEGLDDGRFALYFKIHHALTDGVAAMQLLSSVLSTAPEQRDMAMPWELPSAAERATGASGDHRPAHLEAEQSLARIPAKALSTALGMSADAAGLPGAFIKTMYAGLRNETSAVSMHAPHTIFNTKISAARRFAAQGWPLARLRAVSKSSGTTINDLVLAMCSGAVRSYLLERDALPESSLVSMVPVAMPSKSPPGASEGAAHAGGNAVGAVMVRLGTELADPAARLESVHQSMVRGKEALGAMTPNQILAMSAIGMAPSIVTPMLRLTNLLRPAFNLIISNVPGPREYQYLNGAKLTGTYPLSIPMDGMALNITCNTYAENMEFGLTGCRRSVPSLQRLLGHLDAELSALESAAGVG